MRQCQQRVLTVKALPRAQLGLNSPRCRLSSTSAIVRSWEAREHVSGGFEESICEHDPTHLKGFGLAIGRCRGERIRRRQPQVVDVLRLCQDG